MEKKANRRGGEAVGSGTSQEKGESQWGGLRRGSCCSPGSDGGEALKRGGGRGLRFLPGKKGARYEKKRVWLNLSNTGNAKGGARSLLQDPELEGLGYKGMKITSPSKENGWHIKFNRGERF